MYKRQGTWLAIFDNTGDVTASISKRPDLSPIVGILDEQGDEIFSQADSILLEIDMEKDIVKRTFCLLYTSFLFDHLHNPDIVCAILYAAFVLTCILTGKGKPSSPQDDTSAEK